MLGSILGPKNPSGSATDEGFFKVVLVLNFAFHFISAYHICTACKNPKFLHLYLLTSERSTISQFTQTPTIKPNVIAIKKYL